MMKKVLGAIAAVVAIAVIGATPASAATEFGSTCSAEKSVPTTYTLTTLSAPSSTLPLTAPVSGVVTKVKVQLSLPLPLSIPEQVKLLKPAGGKSYTVTSQAEVHTVTGSLVTETRMPVQAGERLAVRGLPFTYMGSSYPGYEFYCEDPASVLGVNPADVPQGSTAEFSEAPVGQLPLSAVIEPDADHDGYGDETQDKCPQSAAVQTECPTVTVEATASAKRSSVTVLVTTSNPAPVTVAGTVKLGKGKSAKLTSKGQTVSPGKISRFTLKFTKKLKAALSGLSPKQSLKLKVAASATDLIGRVSSKLLTVKLKGQG